MFGFYELERNLIVARLSDGRKRKQMQADVEIKRIRKQNGKLGVGQLTQNGQAKYIGSKSTLHKCIEREREAHCKAEAELAESDQESRARAVRLACSRQGVCSHIGGTGWQPREGQADGKGVHAVLWLGGTKESPESLSPRGHRSR